MKPVFPITAYINILRIKIIYHLTSLAIKPAPCSAYISIANPTLICFLFLIMFSQLPDTLAQSVLHGTSIVGIRTSDEIVVAADSKGVWNKTPNPESVCKIIRIDNLFFAHAGLLIERDTRFSPELIFLQTFKRGNSATALVKQFEENILSPLTQAMESIKQTDEKVFNQQFNGQAAVATLFFGLEGDNLIFFMRDFIPFISPSGQISIRIERKNCPGSDCPTGIAAAYLGEKDAIKEVLKTNPKFWKIGLVEGASRLVELEIAAKPDTVGLPIDIVYINRTGVNWLQRKPECADIISDLPAVTTLPQNTSFSHFLLLGLILSALGIICVWLFRRHIVKQFLRRKPTTEKRTRKNRRKY
jgi:hypothetical protein